MKVTINFSKRWLYTFIAIGILAVIGVGVYAYGTSDPSVFGHSLGELEICADGQILEMSGGGWTCGYMSSSDSFPSGLTWGSGRGALSTDQGASIELGGSGTPFIDFSNDGSIDYDMRIILRGDDALSIDGGNVGIGTTNPLSKLSVGGDGSSSVAIYGQSTTGFGVGVYGRSNSGRGVRGISDTSSGVYGSGLYGVMGIGDYGVSNGLGVYGNGPRGLLGFSGLDSGGTGVEGDAWSSSGCDFRATGAGSNYCSTSSIRWKKDIVPIDNALDKVLNLKGVYFNWDEEHGGEHDMGMIAEEVGEIIPEIVNYEEDGIYARGMDYSALTPVLVEAIKEQQEIIESQQIQINELKTRIEDLEN